MSNVAASMRARLLNVARAQGVDFNQVLVRFAYFGDRDRSFRLKVTGHFGAS